jgi:TonB family protein
VDRAVDPSVIDGEDVLEVQVRWGDTVLDHVQVRTPRDLASSPFARAVAIARIPSVDGLALHERLVFTEGPLTFVARYVRGDASVRRVGPFDWEALRTFVISALAHAFFVFAALITPEGPALRPDELFRSRNHFVQGILRSSEPEKKAAAPSGPKGGERALGEEGRLGPKNRWPKDTQPSRAGAPRIKRNKRDRDRATALDAGLLGVLRRAGGSTLDVFGRGGLGDRIRDVTGGLRGTATGEASGADGLGTRGQGAGGGGDGPLGIGRLGTHGRRSGADDYGQIDLGRGPRASTRVLPGRTIVRGSLTKQQISREISRNIARFKYCYEKELNGDQALAGKIVVYFTIAPTGEVADASIRESSMGSEAVASCLVKVMRSLEFPKPRGGGIVVVTYPFVFAAT